MHIESGWIAVVFGLLTLVAVLAAAVAVARASYSKTQIEALRGDRDDLLARVSILEQKDIATNAELDKTKVSLSAEQDKVKVLESVVSGKEQLDTLLHIVNDMAEKFDDRCLTISTNSNTITTDIGIIKNDIAKIRGAA